jgi:uncharacterized membrane protein YdjX (TVP38/TMEM64 family)
MSGRDETMEIQPVSERSSPRKGGDRASSVRLAARVKWGSIAVGVLAVLVTIQALPVAQGIQYAVGWMERLGPSAPLVYIGLYFLATMLLLPAWPLSVTAGALFGLPLGTLVVTAGATAGAAGAFIVTRYAARDLVERKLRNYPRFAAVDRAVGEGGWRIVALLRLSPALPFTLQNYFYGLTAIRFWPCVLATAVAILPGTFMYVYFGYAGRASLEAAGGAAVNGGWGQWLLLTAGLAATVVVTVYITRLARRAIRQHTPVEPEPPKPSDAVPSGNPWRSAAVSAGVALALVVVAGCVRFQPEFLVRLFGPPAVAMTETYDGVDGDAVFDHSPFDAILGEFVNPAGGVDYQGLKETPDALLSYNAALAEARFDAMGRDERLALLINAYNSFTLQLIVEYLDEGIESIREIPRSKSWDHARWVVGGHTWSLNEIEHERIRPNFREPDIHWALVCAAVGCPPLRNEAYTADRIDEQLRAQAHIVHRNGSRWFRYDREGNTLHLTRLYQWYGGDFEQVAGSVPRYAARYVPALADDLDAGRMPRIEWLEYDWSLNDQENLQ